MGNVTTGEPEEGVSVTNSGTGENAVFDFAIPRGATGADGATGPAGDTGPAATIRVGSVTTGDPGTEASVTNSGTEQEAVLDFVIPRGEAGGGQPLEVLASYTTPSQTAADGGSLLFQQNSTEVGTAISHANGSDTFTVGEPGVYMVTFNGSFSPAAGAAFPLNLVLSLNQNGSALPGATLRHTFHISTENVTIALTEPVTVTGTSTFTITGSGGSYTYSDIALSMHKLGTP